MTRSTEGWSCGCIAPLVDAPLVDAPLVDAPLVDAPLVDAAAVAALVCASIGAGATRASDATVATVPRKLAITLFLTSLSLKIVSASACRSVAA
ncbi:MAG: hypothetical protein DI640_00980 [Sphingomonas taxi]|uniref:Uncharacterized protein n=1 Tax=Sphingomonas taxi TaxID=1549858 RepID=A0A2W5B271_9SPHN|nr:MAG: hypothetical protein DI640_00980 [Sphingomonas taxi]